MRWFVEVSRVGENSSDEKYCVEAKQWQAALQEARKLRGDSGPLSKFSIELLDDGYRAVDPKQKLKYVVAKAPQDAELSTAPPESAFRAETPHLNGQLATSPSRAPAAPTTAPAQATTAAAAVVKPSVAPAPLGVPAPAAPVFKPSAAPAPLVAPAPTPVVSPGPTPLSGTPVASPVDAAAPAPASPGFPAHAEPYAGVPSSDLSPNAPSGVRSTSEGSPGASSADKSPSVFPPRAGSVRPPSAIPPAGVTLPEDVIPRAPALPKDFGMVRAPQNLTQPSPALDMPPPATVLRKRQEEPTAESPITYREVAYVVDPNVTRGAVEALLWASFNDLSRELSTRSGQKFVQLAVFDHKFDKRPEKAPLGTLAWKDWRGNPVLTFPLFDGTQPARASVAPASIVPVAVVKVTGPSGPPPAPEASAAPAAALVPSAVVAAVAEAPAPQPAKSDPGGAAIPLTREKLPSSHPPSAARASRPRVAARSRRAGEDLIGELFETMHDLHFMSGVTDGAEFVLATLDSIIPCDGVLIHVFDINTRQFVVVRAKGPGTMQAILHRTPDSDEFFNNIMRRPRSLAFDDTAKDDRVLGPRWDALGVKPKRALCGPVRQDGRYLGLIEVANPLGDLPFHQTEQNAIDYVCEQFAQFLTNRPIVLDADVIMKR
jgi:hypothetical protein